MRISGRVKKLGADESDAYFAQRPASSRIGAWASEQSQVIAGRAVLSEREARFTHEFGETVPRPPHWGGFCVSLEEVEFWQGRPSRLHDRIRYVRSGATWQRHRLAP